MNAVLLVVEENNILPFLTFAQDNGLRAAEESVELDMLFC